MFPTLTHSEPKEKIDELAAAAVRVRSAGEFAAAAKRYRQILGLAPDHQGALHNLGVVCTAEGLPQENVAGIASTSLRHSSGCAE